jgi:hypothetical protein
LGVAEVVLSLRRREQRAPSYMAINPLGKARARCLRGAVATATTR